jgi:hypothetical protein
MQETATSPTTDTSSTATTIDQAAKTAAPVSNEVKWYQNLDTQFQNNPTVQKYQNQNEFVKAHLELVSKLGSDKIALPKDANDKAGWEAIYEKLGMPKEAKDYEFTAHELPKELGEQNLDGFKQKARELGLSKKQAAELYDWHVGNVKNQYGEIVKQQEGALKQAEDMLRKEFGLNYDSALKASNAAFVKMFGQEGAKQLQNVVGNNPAFIKGMYEVSKMLGEDTIGKFTNSGFTKTPQEAKIELDAIMANPNDPYWGNGDTPSLVQKERVKYVEGLYQMIAGKK